MAKQREPKVKTTYQGGTIIDVHGTKQKVDVEYEEVTAADGTTTTKVKPGTGTSVVCNFTVDWTDVPSKQLFPFLFGNIALALKGYLMSSGRIAERVGKLWEGTVKVSEILAHNERVRTRDKLTEAQKQQRYVSRTSTDKLLAELQLRAETDPSLMQAMQTALADAVANDE